MKLLDQFTAVIRRKHYSLRTEKTYRHWIVAFRRFHRNGKEWRHPSGMGAAEIESYLSHLAVDRRVAAATQNQALNAIVFLYKQVLGVDPGQLVGWVTCYPRLGLPQFSFRVANAAEFDRAEPLRRQVSIAQVSVDRAPWPVGGPLDELVFHGVH